MFSYALWAMTIGIYDAGVEFKRVYITRGRMRESNSEYRSKPLVLSNKHACDEVICVINIDLAPVSGSASSLCYASCLFQPVGRGRTAHTTIVYRLAIQPAT